MRRIAIARVFGLVVMLVCLGLSVYWGLAARGRNAEFYEWLDARPMECAVDLSKPGVITAPFHQTCSVAHDEYLFFNCDLADASRVEIQELFKGLSAHIVIRDSKGEEVTNAEISTRTIKHWNGGIVLTEFTRFRRGDYVSTIRVDSGAPALAGKRQTVYVKYVLCGVEKMPVLILGVLAGVAGVIGLVSAIWTLPRLFRCGIWRDSVARRSAS